MRRPLAGVAVVAALALLGCSDDGGDEGSSSSSGSSSASASSTEDDEEATVETFANTVDELDLDDESEDDVDDLPEGEDSDVFDIGVGDCLASISDLAGSVSEVPVIDCTESHEAEVIFLFEHEGDDDDFPGNDALQAEAALECEGDAFEAYTGTTYDVSAIGIAYITPSEESWSNGDRETICVGALIDGSLVEVSFEGNGDQFPL